MSQNIIPISVSTPTQVRSAVKWSLQLTKLSQCQSKHHLSAYSFLPARCKLRRLRDITLTFFCEIHSPEVEDFGGFWSWAGKLKLGVRNKVFQKFDPIKSNKFSSCGRKTVFLPPWFKQHFESFLLCLPEISVHFWKIWIINTLHKSRIKSRVLVHLTAEQWSAAWLSEWPSLGTRGAAGQNGCPCAVASMSRRSLKRTYLWALLHASVPCVCVWLLNRAPFYILFLISDRPYFGLLTTKKKDFSSTPAKKTYTKKKKLASMTFQKIPKNLRF